MMRPALVTALCLLLAACQSSPEVSRAEPAEAGFSASSAGGAGCWARDRIAARTETRFEIGADGARVAREVEIRPAEDRLFAVPCDDQLDHDTIAALQRALAVRGLHAGVVNGVYDAETAEAVRRYQAPLGLDSAILSLDAARMLGIIAIGRPGS
jgi:hypothetical protein